MAGTPPSLTLEERILRFLEAQPGAENVEKLPLTPAQRAAEKADFFLQQREVICEVKSIQTSTQGKVDALVAPLVNAPNAPVFYGEMRFDKVAKHLPDGPRVLREIFGVLTSSMDTFFRKANRQIRVTRQTFALPNASGGVVVVNDQVAILSPEVMAHRIAELLRKRTPDGGFAYPEIDSVLLVSETHFVHLGQGTKGPLVARISRDGTSKAEAAFDALLPRWAQVNGHAFQEMDPELLGTVKLTENKPVPAGPQKIRRQELWERQYRNRPYLRRHTAEEFKHYFHLLMDSMAVGFLDGATLEQSQMAKALMERWTHFLEEARERGIDFRSFGPRTDVAIGADGKPVLRQATMAEIEATANKPATLEPGRLYTNAAGEYVRCVGILPGAARIVLLTVSGGKNAGALLEVNHHKWQHFWPVLDESLATALGKRFQEIVSDK